MEGGGGWPTLIDGVAGGPPANRVKRGLVDLPDLWAWSSFRFYAYGGERRSRCSASGTELRRLGMANAAPTLVGRPG